IRRQVSTCRYKTHSSVPWLSASSVPSVPSVSKNLHPHQRLSAPISGYKSFLSLCPLWLLSPTVAIRIIRVQHLHPHQRLIALSKPSFLRNRRAEPRRPCDR